MFAILLTFSEVILHTIVGNMREKEKNIPKKMKKVSPTALSFAGSKMAQENVHAISRFANEKFGKVLFPLIFIVFTLIYSGFAMHFYFEERGIIPGDEKCE